MTDSDMLFLILYLDDKYCTTKFIKKAMKSEIGLCTQTD